MHKYKLTMKMYYILFSAVRRLIMINRIQNKSFVYIICICAVHIYYLYINIHMHVYISEYVVYI